MSPGPAEESGIAPFDGKRGELAMGGYWLSTEEALASAEGARFWECESPTGRRVAVQQYSDGPELEPIWGYSNGDMYLGEWKRGANGIYVEHGFGIAYSKFPGPAGRVSIGEFRNGTLHGHAKTFWTETCDVWQNNKLNLSVVEKFFTMNKKRRVHGYPFIYIGNYVLDRMTDPQARIILKDGSERVGPWKNGRPVGKFWKHKLVKPPSDPNEKKRPALGTAVVGERPEKKSKPSSSPPLDTSPPGPLQTSTTETSPTINRVSFGDSPSPRRTIGLGSPPTTQRTLPTMDPSSRENRSQATSSPQANEKSLPTGKTPNTSGVSIDAQLQSLRQELAITKAKEKQAFVQKESAEESLLSCQRQLQTTVDEKDRLQTKITKTEARLQEEITKSSSVEGQLAQSREESAALRLRIKSLERKLGAAAISHPSSLIDEESGTTAPPDESLEGKLCKAHDLLQQEISARENLQHELNQMKQDKQDEQLRQRKLQVWLG